MRRPLDGSPRITTKHGTYGYGYFGQHAGTDYGVPIGTPVKAPCDGRIVNLYRGGSGGNIIEMEGGGKLRRFLHLDEVLVHVGQTVAEGQTIARSGATGKVSGPHLHYDVRKLGTRWNDAFGYYDDPEVELAQANRPKPRFPIVDYSVVGKVLYLKPHVKKWRVYATNQKPIAGKEIYFLSPAKFGGLSYRIQGVAPYPQTVRILTRDRGLVNIYVDGDAEIR